MINREKLEDIIDNVLTDLYVDIESGDINKKEYKTIRTSINWFYSVLTSKLYDYFEFEKESE
jgi:hypothetical protein